jgi:tyrosine-protein kinase Etk/Wzc
MDRTLMEEKEESGGFDVKRFLIKVLKGWPWLLVSVAILGTGAFFYLRYTVPLYQVISFIQIQQGNEAVNILGGTPFAGTGGAASSRNQADMNSEIFKLQSAALVGEVVDSLNLIAEVSKKGKVKEKPMLLDSLPFTISVHKTFEDNQSPQYRLTLSDNHYTLQTEKTTINGLYEEPLLVNGDTVTITPKYAAKMNGVYQFRILSRSSVVARYVGRLFVAPVPKGGMGMLQVAVKDEMPQRARKVIELLVKRYDYNNLDFKNKALRSELEFLDARLSSVNGELQAQENYVRDFKAGNKINDVSSSANQLLSSLTNIDSKKSENEYKESLLRLVESNINNNPDERINAPGLQDAELVMQIGKYNDLVQQKGNILAQGAPQDPRLPGLNTKIEESKKSITSRIASIREELQTNNRFLASQERNTSGRFMQLPEKEKDYIQVNRLLNIKQSLYVFLLQRKEDKNIEYASSGINGSRIIDWNVNRNAQKPLIIYSIAVALGILIPALVILVSAMLNKRIETWEDVYKTITIPIAGEIGFEKLNGEAIVVNTGDKTPIAEQFRTLRTNMNYFTHGATKVIMVTSSISGEGKSFISLNLANAIAITNKKVVLLEFDLRNPGLSSKLGIEGVNGLTNYLRGECEMKDTISQVSDYENLSFISAGTPLPDNPGEIILNNRMDEIFGYLKKQFDVIIVDTPPIEAVSDALTLGKWADMSFYIVRHKYSRRSSLPMINQLNQDQKLPRPALIINGVKPGHGFQNVYGYGYGAEYGKKSKKKNINKNLKIA